MAQGMSMEETKPASNESALAKLTDQEFNDLILSCRWGNGYIIYPPMASAITREFERRDPSGTWGWGVPGGPTKENGAKA